MVKTMLPLQGAWVRSLVKGTKNPYATCLCPKKKNPAQHVNSDLINSKKESIKSNFNNKEKWKNMKEILNDQYKNLVRV